MAKGNWATSKRKSKTHTWKVTPIPDGFILKIDTREQDPLFVKKLPKGLVVVRDTVKHGDYTIQGFEDKICIERKQLSDFMSYIGKERDRTKKKLEAMAGLWFKALVIEESEKNLLSPYQIYTQLTPEHVRGFLKSVQVRYGVHVYMNSKRDELERWVLDRLTYAYSVLREV